MKVKTPQIIANKIAEDISQKLFQRSFNDLKRSDDLEDIINKERVVAETREYYKEMKKISRFFKNSNKRKECF